MYILTERQKQIAAGALVAIPADWYRDVFNGEHDIAFSEKAFILAREARNEKATLRDVVARILLMSCKNIVCVIDAKRGAGRNEFLFEVRLNDETKRLRAVMVDEEYTITIEGEDIG